MSGLLSSRIRELFPGAEAGPYFNTASMALGNNAAIRTLGESLEAWRTGDFSFEDAERSSEENRRIVAAMIGSTPEEVAMVNAVSTAAGLVAQQLPAGRGGANIVVPAMEFTSNLFPWLQMSDHGYEVRLVEARGGTLELEDVFTVVDEQTALVAVSAVQSLNGFRLNLRELADIAHRSAAWLAVDASQALGAVDVDVVRDDVDLLFACSHKFLLGMRGLAYLYVRSGLLESFRPITPGWRAAASPLDSFYGPEMELSGTASRLDTSLPWFNSLADLEGLRLLENVGVPNIEAHNRVLMDLLEEGLAASGLVLDHAGASRSQIVSFEVQDPASIARALAGQRIRASVRGQGLRVAVHLYNSSADVARLVAAIAAV